MSLFLNKFRLQIGTEASYHGHLQFCISLSNFMSISVIKHFSTWFLLLSNCIEKILVQADEHLELIKYFLKFILQSKDTVNKRCQKKLYSQIFSKTTHA